MADSKISELLEVTVPAANDLLVIVDQSELPPTTKQIQYGNLVGVDAFVSSLMNNTQATGSTNGTYTTLNFNNDYASFLNSAIDRPTVSRFRSLKNAWYKVTYHMYGVPSANDSGSEIRMIKNGVASAVDGSIGRISRSRNEVAQGGICSNTFFIQLLVNDYLEMQATPTDGVAVTFQSFSKINFEIYKGI